MSTGARPTPTLGAVAALRAAPASIREAFAEIAEDTRRRIRVRGRSALLRALRLTSAAVVSYVVAHGLSPNTIPILAPLTALLVVQVTLSGTLHSGIERVVSVVAGVLLAVIFSAVAGLAWWSLAALVLISILIGQLLKLGPNTIEVPISAMLVLAVGSSTASDAALGRINETAVGAVVGVAFNLIFPPAIRQLDAGARLERFAARIAEILDAAASDLSAGPIGTKAQGWLDEARRLTRQVPEIDREITRSGESRHLNVRALGTPDAESSLKDGLDALEHSLVAVRSLFRSIVDAVRISSSERAVDDQGAEATADGEDLGIEAEDDDYAQDVREAFAILLRDLASCFRSFGRMARAHAEYDAQAESAQTADALADLREARARVSEMLLLGPREDPEYWELNVTLLATVERVLRELDLGEYSRVRAAALAERDEGLLKAQTHQAASRLRRTARRL